MALTEQEVKDLTKERTDATSRAKAEAFLARKNADEAKGWYWFLRNHAGQRGLENGQYYECDANDLLISQWLEANQLPVTERSLEQAYQANKHRLGNPPAQTYERVTDTQQSRVFPQIRGFQTTAPPAYTPYTRAEVLGWSAARLHRELAKGKSHVDAINAILAGQH